MLLKIYLIPRVKILTLLYILGNLFALGQSKENVSNKEENDKTTLSIMKHFLEGVVMHHMLKHTENPQSKENTEKISTEYLSENISNTDENTLSIPINGESNNNLYYNSIIGNEILSNYINDPIEDQVLNLYDTVTSHPLFYKVLSKGSFHTIVAEVTRLTLVINSTGIDPEQGDSIESQEVISYLIPTVNSVLESAISELNQELDIVKPVIHNVTSTMQEIMSDDKIDENDVLDLIYDILPDPVGENYSEDHVHALPDPVTISNEVLFEEIIRTSSNASVTSTNQKIAIENTLNDTTLNSSHTLNNTSPFKENITETEENHIQNVNKVTTSLESNAVANISSMLDILKLTPGGLHFDPYDPMSYILALQSVYNQSNHVNNKHSGANPGIPQDDRRDIIEVPNNMPAYVMTPGQYINSPLIANDEEIVNTGISNGGNNVSENNDTKEISIGTENPNVNSSLIQNIKEKDPTLIEGAEMLIKIMSDSLSVKLDISVNDTDNYNENNDKIIQTSFVSSNNEKGETSNNAEYMLDMLQQSMTPKPIIELEISVNNTDNSNENYDKVIQTSFVSSNNEKNETSSNAGYLLGMMQQSMTPKPITEQSQSHNSILNNFLKSWFKPILEYANKTSNVISSLPEAAVDLLKNPTYQWPNIIATDITKDTEKPKKNSVVETVKQNISHGNKFPHSISVNNTVSNHIPSSPINLNINIFQNGNQQIVPSQSTISSDIYDYYEAYDYEFPKREGRDNENDDSILTKLNEDITTELYTTQPYTTESVDRTTIIDKAFTISQDEIASNIVIKSSIERIGTVDLPDKEFIAITKPTSRPSPKQTTTVAWKRAEPGQKLLAPLPQEQIDSDNPFQFPRTTTVPPPEGIDPTELLLSKTQNVQRNNKQKPTRQQLEDALLLLLDLQDEFNTRNIIQPLVNASPPPQKPPLSIINLQGPPGSGTGFQVSMSYGTGQGQTFDGTIVQPNQQNPYPRQRPSEQFTHSVQPQPASISSSDSYNPYPIDNAQGSNGGSPYPNYPPPSGYPGYPAPPPFPPPNYPPYSPYPYPHYGGCQGGQASTSTSTGQGSAAAAAAAGGGCGGGGGSTSTSTSVKQSAGSGSSPGTVAVDVGNSGGGGAAPSIPQAPFRPQNSPSVIPASAPSPIRRPAPPPSTRAPPFSISFGNGRRTTTVAPQTDNLSPQEYDRVVGALNTLLGYLRKRQTQSAAAPPVITTERSQAFSVSADVYIPIISSLLRRTSSRSTTPIPNSGSSGSSYLLTRPTPIRPQVRPGPLRSRIPPSRTHIGFHVIRSTTPRPRRGGIVGLLQGLLRGGSTSSRVPAAPSNSRPRPTNQLPQQPSFGHNSRPRPTNQLPQQPSFGHYPYSLPGASCFTC